MNQFVTTERIEASAIPCLKFRPMGQMGVLPTIIDYHGWRSGKEYKRFTASILATYGFQVIVPDAIHHGERGVLDYNDPRVLAENFWKIIFQTVDESGLLIDCLFQEHGADPDRLGVSGTSMGGFSAAGVLRKDRRVKCAVIINGSCAWVKAEEVFREIAGHPPAGPEAVACIARYDPLAQPEALGGRPLLMLHGDQDTTVPIDSQRFFFQEMAPAYAPYPERLRLVEVPRMNHYTSTNMLEQGVGWMEMYL